MRTSRLITAVVTLAVFALGLTALFSAGGGTAQTNALPTVEIGVAKTPVQSAITIPNVKGETVVQASQTFFDLGFQAVYAANVNAPGERAGTVVEQMPAAGSRGTLVDTSVHLTVAASNRGAVRFVPHRKG